MPTTQLLELSERELRYRGLWPDPADTYADVNLIESPDEMTITAAYTGSLDDSAETREKIERLLFRRLTFVYHGGLLARVPDAVSNGKQLAVMLLIPAEDIPPMTLDMLQEYSTIYSGRKIGLRVIQVPRENL